MFRNYDIELDFDYEDASYSAFVRYDCGCSEVLGNLGLDYDEAWIYADGQAEYFECEESHAD